MDVDRLDHLMNLAGELVISKARFFEIARGLEELFRGSNAQLLALDTRDRLEGLASGLAALDDGGGGAGGPLERWAAQFRRLRDNFRAIQAELDLVRKGVQAYEGLRADLSRSVPFWPLGMPTSLDPVVVLGLRGPSATYVYVWFTQPGKHGSVVLDLPGPIGDLEVVYPTSLDGWEIAWDHAGRLTVAPDVSGLTARVLRIGRS